MADYEVVSGVAVITCLNPPVNQLSYSLRVGLFSGLEEGLKDPKVKAIVIVGSSRSFPAGADIKEFATGEGMKQPITDFIPKCEAATKPVVAAIHGTALGGGLEVALGCHYRIGTSRCRVGFPEVLIGLLPGAGGTQRLPRLIGPMMAAEIIVSGQHVNADRALKLGILDRVVNIEPNHDVSMEQLIIRQSAIQFAQEIAHLPLDNRRISTRPCVKLNDFFYDQIRAMTMKKARGMLAPELNLQAVRAAHTEPTFEAGLKKERELFMKLLTDSQSRALQHIFFAEREISKVPGISPTKAKKLKKVGVVGCGTMGGGIAMNFVQIGIPVVILESKQEFLDHGLAIIRRNWMSTVKKGKLSPKTFEKYMSLIKPTTQYKDFADVDLVIEAVFENMSIKKEVFRNLDAVCKPSCILATNTSFLDVGEIAKTTSRPHKVVGTHFFAPANVMQLLENVRHSQTDEETIATVQEMGKQIKKKGVLVKVCDGFVGNRMFGIEQIEVYRIVLEGALPQQVDKVMFNFGWAMGPFQVNDLSGNDIGFRRRDELGLVAKPFEGPLGDYSPFVLGDTLVKEYNRLGLKTGKGWYDYEEGQRKPIPSKQVEELIVATSKKQGITRRKISDEEILERIMYPFVNEGFKIIEEGIALRPSDVDIVFVFGYGFPPYRGGPMFWADLVGLPKIRDTLLSYASKYPNAPHFKPAKLLNELADKKISLAKYWKDKEKSASKNAKL